MHKRLHVWEITQQKSSANCINQATSEQRVNDQTKVKHKNSWKIINKSIIDKCVQGRLTKQQQMVIEAFELDSIWTGNVYLTKEGG